MPLPQISFIYCHEFQQSIAGVETLDNFKKLKSTAIDKACEVIGDNSENSPEEIFYALLSNAIDSNKIPLPLLRQLYLENEFIENIHVSFYTLNKLFSALREIGVTSYGQIIRRIFPQEMTIDEKRKIFTDYFFNFIDDDRQPVDATETQIKYANLYFFLKSHHEVFADSNYILLSRDEFEAALDGKMNDDAFSFFVKNQFVTQMDFALLILRCIARNMLDDLSVLASNNHLNEQSRTTARNALKLIRGESVPDEQIAAIDLTIRTKILVHHMHTDNVNGIAVIGKSIPHYCISYSDLDNLIQKRKHSVLIALVNLYADSDQFIVLIACAAMASENLDLLKSIITADMCTRIIKKIFNNDHQIIKSIENRLTYAVISEWKSMISINSDTFIATLISVTVDNISIVSAALSAIPLHDRSRILDTPTLQNPLTFTRLRKIIWNTNNMSLIRQVDQFDSSTKVFDPKTSSWQFKIPQSFYLSTAHARLTDFLRRKSSKKSIETYTSGSQYNAIACSQQHNLVDGIDSQLRQAVAKIKFEGSHVASSTEKLEAVINDAKLVSLKRLQRDFGGQIGGTAGILTDTYNDQRVFFCLGAASSNTKKIGFLRDNEDYIVLDVDAFAEQTDSLVFKSYDWGMDVDLQNASYRFANGWRFVSNYAAIRLIRRCQWFDGNHKPLTEPYEILNTQEVYVGSNFKPALANWVAGHIAKLPNNRQKELFDHLNEDPVTRFYDLFAHFFDIELSIASAVKLDIAYINAIKIRGQYYPLKELRLKLVESDDPHESIIKFFNDYSYLKTVAFVYYGAIALAHKQGHRLTTLALYRLNASPKFNAHIILIPAQLSRIQRLLCLICDAKSDLIQLENPGDKLYIKMASRPESSSEGIHYAELVQILVALGNTYWPQHHALESRLPERLELTLNGQPNSPEAATGHGIITNINDVENKLLTHELTTLFTSIINANYYRQHGALHPVTGRGANHGSTKLLPQRLGEVTIHARFASYPREQLILSIHSTDDSTNLSEIYKSMLLQALPTVDPSRVRVIDNNTLYINYRFYSFMELLKRHRINYHGLIFFDDNGRLLLADRFGLTSPGGHHGNPYAAYIAYEVHSEFALNTPLDLQTPVYCFDHGNAIFMLHASQFSPTDAASSQRTRLNLAVPFRADPREFTEHSEQVLALHELRGKQLRQVMPIKAIVRYLTEQVQQKINSVNTHTVRVKINDDYQEATINGITMLIPGSRFGEIKLATNQPSLLDNFYEHLRSNDGVAVIIQDNNVIIDNMSPLQLATHFVSWIDNAPVSLQPQLS